MRYGPRDECHTRGCRRPPMARGLCELCYHRDYRRKRKARWSKLMSEKLLAEIRVWVADGRATSTDARLVEMVDGLREERDNLARVLIAQAKEMIICNEGRCETCDATRAMLARIREKPKEAPHA